MALIIPEEYVNLLGGVENTEKAIKAVKDMFQDNLSAQLALLRVTAPMVVLSGTGLNDDLNGVERQVNFPIKDMDEQLVINLEAEKNDQGRYAGLMVGSIDAPNNNAGNWE